MADYSDYGGVPFLQNYDQHESNTASSLQDHGNTSSQVVKAQNMAAFQQNSMLPPVTSLQPSTAQNQAHINSLLQQLQAAGYTLPPMAPQEASQSGQNVPLPQPSHNATNGTPLGSNSRGRIGDLRSDREEGELSETDMTSSPAGRSGYAAPRTNAADVSRMPGNGNNNYRPRYDRNDSNGSFPGRGFDSPNVHGLDSRRDSRRSPAGAPSQNFRAAHRSSPHTPQNNNRRQPDTRQSLQKHAQKDTRPQEAPRQQPSQSDTPFSATATQEHSSTSGLAQNPEANRLIEQIIEDLGISSASDKAAQSLAQQHDDARKFVSLLSFYGYVFKHLIDETFYFTNNADWGWLAKLYKELKISESQVQQQEEPVNMGQQQSAASDTSKLSQAAAKEPLPKSTPRADGLLREPPRGPASTSRTPSRASQKTSAKPQESKPAAKPAETKSAAKAEETKSTTAPAFGQPSSLGDKPIGKPALPQSQPGGATQSPGTDRASYLAKLKAAKMKVGSKANETIAKSNASSATPPVQAPKPAQQPASRIAQPAGKTGSAGAMEDIVTEPAVPVPSSVQDDAETRKKAQTELLQKKLAELKAKQGSQPAPKPSVPAPSQDALPAAPNGPDLHTQNIAFVQNSFPHVAPTFSQAQGSPPQAGSPTGGIPGLFMSTAPPNASPQPAGQDSSQTRPRKRPVAADFDDFNSETPLRPSKRPTFGDDPSAVNVDEKMVIDVSSDDESDNDGGVDLLEDVDDLINAAAQNVPNQQKQRALRDVGPLTNFPARGQVSIRSSALSTPGGTNTPHPDQLSDMDAKIAMLKAEIIAKQAAQKRRGESRPQTPFKKPDKAGEPPQLRGGEAAHSSPISEQNHLLTRNGREAPLLSQIAAAPASSIRSQSPVEHRLRRQSEIESIDASVSSNISKVELLHREIQALEADNKKRLEEKEALAKELEDNGVDTEGMGDEEMKAARDEIRVQQEQEQRQNEEVAVVEDTGLTEQTDRADLDVLPEAQDDIEAAPIVLSEELPSTDRALDMITEAQQFNSDAQPIEEPSNDTDVRQDVVNDSLLGINEDCEPRVQETGNDQDEETMNFEIYGDSNAEIVAAADPSPQLQMEGIIDTAAPDMAADTQNQDQEMQEGDDESEDFYSPGDAEQASLPQPIVPATAPADDFEMSDDEDTFTPDPPAEADILPETTAIPPNAVLQEDMQMSDGEVAETPTQEVAASASSSPDSIAAIEAAERPAAEEVPRGYPGTFTPETSSEDSSEEEEEDDYEPPGPVDGAVEAEPATALEDGAVIQEVVEEEDYEPPDADDDSQDSGSALVINDMQSARQSGTPEEGAVPLADDLAPELQPNPAADELSHTPTATEGYFRPYESSLASFKAYRYHPQFTENVQGGFRSMTYSHKIDPHKELCQYEADGGVCNDKDCQHQHYRDMKLTDDMILVQLGTANPGKTEEERNRWVQGLRDLLKRMRENNMTNPNTVVQEIAKYRRTFLGDPSKILNL